LIFLKIWITCGIVGTIAMFIENSEEVNDVTELIAIIIEAICEVSMVVSGMVFVLWLICS